MTKDNNCFSHDGLFKKIMETKVGMQQFLEHYLPPYLKQEVDLSTARLEKESYVEDDLKKLLSDAVISVKKKDREKIYTYVLAEHQSTSDKWIALRLLEYTIRLLKRHKTQKEKLPLVYPVVVYNGIKPYAAPRNIWALFEDPVKAKEIISGDYELVDLRSKPDEDIINKGHWGMLEYAMKYIYTKDMTVLWDNFFHNFKAVIEEDKKSDYVYIKSLLWYIDSKAPIEDKVKIGNITNKHLSRSEGDKIMRTIAQDYIEKGREQGIILGIEKGIEKGREEEKLGLAKSMLENGIKMELVMKVTGLPKSRIEKLKK